jgi:hypothetical protein
MPGGEQLFEAKVVCDPIARLLFLSFVKDNVLMYYSSALVSES